MKEEKEPSITTRSLRKRKGPAPVYNFKNRHNVCVEKKDKKSNRPRWYNQTYIMFITLRDAKRPLPRNVLIRRTLTMDFLLSTIMSFPKCFHGKTPVNTASMILTVNRDKLFDSEKPPGARSHIFRLTYEPCNFDKAVEYYNEWNEELKRDWWWTFSKKRNYGFDTNININDIEKKPKKGRKRKRSDKEVSSKIIKTNERNVNENEFTNDYINSKEDDNKKESEAEDSDDEFIPTSLEDIVEVKESTIKNAGRGLFAKCLIPQWAVIGFYFGVPMTEYEFDLLKDGKGLASNYAIRYRKTVLDATDENGQPYWNNPKIFCPFHFMNESSVNNVEFREGNKVNQVLCIAIKEIKPGEEIFVDYGKEIDRTKWGSDAFNNYADNFSDGDPNSLNYKKGNANKEKDNDVNQNNLSDNRENDQLKKKEDLNEDKKDLENNEKLDSIEENITKNKEQDILNKIEKNKSNKLIEKYNSDNNYKDENKKDDIIIKNKKSTKYTNEQPYNDVDLSEDDEYICGNFGDEVVDILLEFFNSDFNKNLDLFENLTIFDDENLNNGKNKYFDSSYDNVFFGDNKGIPEKTKKKFYKILNELLIRYRDIKKEKLANEKLSNKNEITIVNKDQPINNMEEKKTNNNKINMLNKNEINEYSNVETNKEFNSNEENTKIIDTFTKEGPLSKMSENDNNKNQIEENSKGYSNISKIKKKNSSDNIKLKDNEKSHPMKPKNTNINQEGDINNILINKLKKEKEKSNSIDSLDDIVNNKDINNNSTTENNKHEKLKNLNKNGKRGRTKEINDCSEKRKKRKKRTQKISNNDNDNNDNDNNDNDNNDNDNNDNNNSLNKNNKKVNQILTHNNEVDDFDEIKKKKNSKSSSRQSKVPSNIKNINDENKSSKEINNKYKTANKNSEKENNMSSEKKSIEEQSKNENSISKTNDCENKSINLKKRSLISKSNKADNIKSKNILDRNSQNKGINNNNIKKESFNESLNSEILNNENINNENGMVLKRKTLKKNLNQLKNKLNKNVQKKNKENEFNDNTTNEIKNHSKQQENNAQNENTQNENINNNKIINEEILIKILTMKIQIMEMVWY
ncbi:hypothetical protein BCR36DRAFT_16089 [Piromyces finnis]|uniref:SET domain-containing protein n=1 Tax=Piromyces finnis TaxID=1754191 RepID=A0A1Y1VED9_9FUNG|nr:hypothetical protein BCR36DRAFT_16089 [Piromyces finnis]|eukprot:ORX54215.1 hypothetical protein BCR36DRAFT_16089 [Piromyces finnis]